jgi:hypothetical protein
VERDDTEQVAAGNFESAAALPAGHLARAESGQPSHLCWDVVGFDVDVVARGVVDRLYGDDEIQGPRYAACGTAAHRAECWSGPPVRATRTPRWPRPGQTVRR